jgi:transposase
VPGARGGGRRGALGAARARFTTAFEDTAAWLVCHATVSVVAMLLRVAWRSVADIITRVVADRAGKIDRLAGLRRIGIDEISYRKGQRYLLCAVDHDTGAAGLGGARTPTPPPCAGSSTCSATRRAHAHPRLRRRRAVDSTTWSPSAPRTPCAALTRFMATSGLCRGRVR